MSEKPTNEELAALLDDALRREEWSGVDALSAEDREARLARSGIDRAKARAVGEAVFDAIGGAARSPAEAPPAPAPPPALPPPTPIPITRARRSWPTYAAVLAAAALVLLFLHPWRDDPNIVSGGDDAAALAADAARLRELALDDYAGGRFDLARGKLDRARALDDGKEPASATELRRKVMAALGDAGATRAP